MRALARQQLLQVGQELSGERRERGDVDRRRPATEGPAGCGGGDGEQEPDEQQRRGEDRAGGAAQEGGAAGHGGVVVGRVGSGRWVFGVAVVAFGVGAVGEGPVGAEQDLQAGVEVVADPDGQGGAGFGGEFGPGAVQGFEAEHGFGVFPPQRAPGELAAQRAGGDGGDGVVHPLDQRVATNRRGCRSTVGIVPIELSAAEIDAAEIIANKVRTVETRRRVRDRRGRGRDGC